MHRKNILFLYVLIFASSIFLVSYENSYAAEIICEQEILKSDSKNPKEKFKKGYCHNLLGNHEKALKSLKRLERKLPELKDHIYFVRADSEKNVGNIRQAKKLYKEIVIKSPRSIYEPKSKEKMSEIFIESGQFNDAVVLYKNLYETEPSIWEKAKYINKIAEVHIKKNDLRAAFNTYRDIWTNHPQTTYSRKIYEFSSRAGMIFTPTQYEIRTRADNLFKLQLWEPALNEYEKLPRSNDIKEKIGICLYHSARHWESHEILKNISTPQAMFWKGRALNKIGRSGEAAKILSEVHLLYPNHKLASKALYKAGIIEKERGRLTNAAKIYKTLIRKYPNSEEAPGAGLDLGKALYKRGMYSSALEIFSNFSYPKTSFYFQSSDYWKGKCLEKLGKKFEAFNIYRSIALTPYYTYHSFLARKKIGYEPKIYSSGSYSNAFSDNIKKKKAILLAEMGIYDLAEAEIKQLEKEANSQEEKILISSLYEKTQNYYKSANIANNIQHPAAYKYAYPKPFSEQVETSSIRYGLDELLVYSLIREESRFNKKAVSRSNARGLMQLIPVTARETADRVGIYPFNLDMLFEPEVNVELGSYYLRGVLDRYRGEIPLALASYNAGPGRVAEWLREYRYAKIDEFIEEIPFEETRKYVKRILRSYGAYKALYLN